MRFATLLFLMLVAGLAVASGCGSDNNSGSTPTVAPTAVATTTADDLLSEEALQFIDEVGSLLDDEAALLGDFADASSNIDVTEFVLGIADPTRFEDIRSRFREIETAILRLKPTPGFEETHDLMIEANDEYADAIDLSILAIKQGDTDLLDEASTHLKQGTELINAATEALAEAFD